MKLLSICPYYYPAFKYGGLIQSVHLLNKTLIQKGMVVDVLTTNAGLENRKDIPINNWVDLDGVNVKYLKYYGYEQYNFSPSTLFQLFKIVKNYDIVYIPAIWNFPVLVGSWASILHKKPYIIAPRGTLYEEAFNIKSKNKKAFYYLLFAKHYIKHANALHFTCADEKDKTLSFLNLRKKYFVIPNGVDLSEFSYLPEKGYFTNKYGLFKNKKYILFLGRINQIKGLDILIKAFNKLTKDYNDLYLVIVGPDNEGYGEKLRSWLKEFGITDKVLFTGMLTGKDKLSAYVDAELFILPSYSENFGMVVAEAMACGTPVVISNKVGIYKEVEENKAGIIVDTTPESLYNGMKLLLDDQNLKREIAFNGRNFVTNYYDINKVANMMIKAFEEILNGNRKK